MSYLRHAFARVRVEPSANVFTLASPPPKEPSLHKPCKKVTIVSMKSHRQEEMIGGGGVGKVNKRGEMGVRGGVMERERNERDREGSQGNMEREKYG